MSSPATNATSTGQAGGSGDPSGQARVGDLIAGRYRIQQLLGEGGMGAVYLAEHTLMRKRVALKLLHAEMGRNAEILARFEREAVAAAHIEHPHVAAATDFGRTDDGAFFLVLEYIEGTNLREAMARGPLSAGRALRIARQVASALERAHDAGIVHRDLKPENVMLMRRPEEPDFVKVLDFGIAKLSEEAIRERGGEGAGQPLTRMGTILGTPEYMAPEQALGEPVSAQADLYALGVMLYEMLTGLHPFDPPDRTAMLSFHIVAPVPAMRDRAPDVDVPPIVELVVRKLLEKDAKARFASARALIDAVDGALAQLDEDVRRGRGAPASAATSNEANVSPSSQSWKASDSFAKTSHGEGEVPAGLAHLTTSAQRAPADAHRAAAATSVATVDTALAQEARAGASPLATVVETLKRQPRPVLIAVVAALPLGAILMVVLALVVSPRSKDDQATQGAAVVVPKKVDKSKLASDEKLAAASAKGPEALEALAKDFPEDARVLQKAALAYHAGGRDTEAMRILTDAAASDPRNIRTHGIVDMVGDVASKPRGEGADAAFVLLENALGSEGVEALAEIASKGPTKELRTRASKLLAKPDVRSRATPATAVLLDFRSATACSAKRELLGRARDEGDSRMLAALKPLKSPRGCGFLGARDCWPCMRKDDALDDAISTIEARAPESKSSTPK